MPVGEMPILEILIRRLKASGVTDVTLAVGYLASLIMAYFANGERLGLTIGYSMEDTPLGTAGPLRLVPNLTETFLVMNGDLLTDLDFDRMRIRIERRLYTSGEHKAMLDPFLPENPDDVARVKAWAPYGLN